ncbi:YaiI/YqxD family protein [Escherichia fergusonii]|uniref:YaiI/YqxD family protein n=1 Tax=Escherichia fergusonii TaxID=564 RepID=UPI001EC4AE75|nr:YaiI/YqxD family protein [Escherichia fergusonii]EHJ4134749.1 YaiI/YqxD family protein [Escherichia fergusonii]
MTIWVDADACPNVIKEILYRAAERMQLPLILVANQSLRVPPSRFIRTLRVAAGFDVADNEIVRQCEPGDLVITADIPLASEVLAKGVAALNPRGERYSEATIRERLTMRDFMDTLRASGIQTGGPDALSPSDRQHFAAELDKWWLEAKRKKESM